MTTVGQSCTSVLEVLTDKMYCVRLLACNAVRYPHKTRQFPNLLWVQKSLAYTCLSDKQKLLFPSQPVYSKALAQALHCGFNGQLKWKKKRMTVTRSTLVVSRYPDWQIGRLPSASDLQGFLLESVTMNLRDSKTVAHTSARRKFSTYISNFDSLTKVACLMKVRRVSASLRA